VSATASVSSELRTRSEESTFFDWLHHYGALISVFLIGGIVAGMLFASLSRSAQSATLIVYQGHAVPAREFGVVAEAVFRSDATLRPAMDELGISTSTSQFLDGTVQLRPVPDAKILIVVGRASGATRAEQISTTTASALRTSLAGQGLDGLSLLPGGVTSGSLAPRVLAALGALAGGLLGLAVAIVHYRARRPTMSLRRAVDLVAPESVALLEGRAPWLGALRRRPWLRRGERNETTFALLAVRQPNASLVIPGRARHRERALRRRLVDASSRRRESAETPAGIGAGHRADEPPFRSISVGRPTLLVADAQTSERELLPEVSGRTEREVHLVWIR